MKIRFEEAKTLKALPTDESKLGFGRIFTDYMYVMDYAAGQGWHDSRVVPYAPLTIDPAAVVFHYGQTVFEGMKAYRKGDEILLFRPDQNLKRLQASCRRICIPAFDEEAVFEGLKYLLAKDARWVPHSEGCSLYIRPFIIANEYFLGVNPSSSYQLIIILSPSGPYYASGLDPVRIYVEENYVRAVPGGMGEAKTAGNYAASLIGQVEAHKKGYSQVLWLDGVHRKYIEEVGAMNIFFVINGQVVTPALNGSILPGITRKSVIELLASRGIKVEERKISIDEVVEAYERGKLQEVFGTGTAAVISPVGELGYQGRQMVINNNQIGPISQKLYDDLTAIQWGRAEGPAGWSIRAV